MPFLSQSKEPFDNPVRRGERCIANRNVRILDKASLVEERERETDVPHPLRCPWQGKINPDSWTIRKIGTVFKAARAYSVRNDGKRGTAISQVATFSLVR